MPGWSLAKPARGHPRPRGPACAAGGPRRITWGCVPLIWAPAHGDRVPCRISRALEGFLSFWAAVPVPRSRAMFAVSPWSARNAARPVWPQVEIVSAQQFIRLWLSLVSIFTQLAPSRTCTEQGGGLVWIIKDYEYLDSRVILRT